MLAFARRLVSRLLPRRPLGSWSEGVAARYLRRQGLRILGRNVRAGGGEIDIIASDGEAVVFVEVKSTTAASIPDGFERIDAAKRRYLGRAMGAWIAGRRSSIRAWRLDVVVVEIDIGRGGRRRARRIRWHPAAFDIE